VGQKSVSVAVQNNFEGLIVHNNFKYVNAYEKNEVTGGWKTTTWRSIIYFLPRNIMMVKLKM
jgi:hypothetical protein